MSSFKCSVRCPHSSVLSKLLIVLSVLFSVINVQGRESCVNDLMKKNFFSNVLCWVFLKQFLSNKMIMIALNSTVWYQVSDLLLI